MPMTALNHTPTPFGSRSGERYLRKNGRSVNAGRAMNSLLVIFALKALLEYPIDSRSRSCTASIADTNRDGNPARNPA
jgi:hypothetical protein